MNYEHWPTQMILINWSDRFAYLELQDGGEVLWIWTFGPR